MRIFSKFLAIILMLTFIMSTAFASEAVKGSAENPYKWKEIPATWIKQAKKDGIVQGYTITVANGKTSSFKLSGTQFKEYSIKGSDGKFGKAIALNYGKLRTIKNVSVIRVVLRVANIDPLGLLGDGQGSTGVALVIVDSKADKIFELDKAKGSEFLSQIDFSQFTSANMTQEIIPPYAMVSEVGTAGNYICIGMSHTNVLYVYDTQVQALLIGADNKYYDIPSGMYGSIKSVLDSY